MEQIISKLVSETKPKLRPFFTDASPELIEFAIGKAMQGAFIYYLPMTTIAVGIGKKLAPGLDLEDKEREVLWFRIGFRVLEVLSEENIIEMDRNQSQARSPYMVLERNKKVIDAILLSTSVDIPEVKVSSLPQFTKPEEWTSFYHPVAGPLVRNTNRRARSYFKRSICPKVYKTINKQQNVAYRASMDVLEALEASSNDPLFTLEGKRYSQEQKDGIKLQRKMTMDLFRNIGDRTWWEYKFYDFRGRIYSACNYAGSSSKIAKSLTQLADKKALGTEGVFWLMIHGANTWGEDKLSLDERYNYALEHKAQWLEIGKDPINNKVWQEADSPFEFLAFAIELYKAHTGGWEDYESGLIVALDASNSGSQILAAMLRDREVGELCNITSKEERGDSYLAVADHVWSNIKYDAKDEEVYERITSDLRALDYEVERLYRLRDKTALERAYGARRAYLEANKESIYVSANVFWGRLHDKRRKICKRGVMTYAYSAGAKCIADQLIEDFYADFDDLNTQFSFFLGLRIYNACRKILKSPTQLMDLFIQMGINDYKEGDDFGFINPVGFYCLQNYRDDENTKLNCYINGERLQVRLITGKKVKLNYRDVKSSTSPNVVHSLDSALLSAITLKVNYPMVTIHDSFGCLAADAGKLFEDTREAFVEMFGHNDVLEDICQQKGLECELEYGDLDVISESGSSDFMFS